jgi:predicted phage baseplate assembly protein
MSPQPWIPTLIDTDAQAVRQAVRARLASYVPEWSVQRGDDPGVALVKAFAEQAAAVRTQVDRLRGQVVRQFLGVAGTERIPVVPAQVIAEFLVAEDADVAVAVPAGFAMSALTPASPDPVTFETDTPLEATAARLATVLVQQGLQVTEQDTPMLSAGTGTVSPFGTRPASGNAIWLGFAGGAPPTELSLALDFGVTAGRLEPVEGGAVAVNSGPAIVWHALTAEGALAATVVRDTTGQWSRRGIVTLRLPPDWRPLPPPAGAPVGRACRWLRATLLAGRPARPIVLRGVVINAVGTSAVRTVVNQVLEPVTDPLSPGQPRFMLPFVPAVPSSLVLEVDEGAGGDVFDVAEEPAATAQRRWTLTESFAGAGPDDRVFLLDAETGEITFGDGIRGTALPQGYRNVRVVRYRVPSGSVSRVPAGQAFIPAVNLPFLSGATARWPASGGFDAEPADGRDEVSDRALAAIGGDAVRAGGRAVTPSDYELLARQVPGADVARAIAVGGLGPDGAPAREGVTVFVLSRRSAPRRPPLPDAATLAAVADGLTSSAVTGVRVTAAPPRFRSLSVWAVVQVDLAVSAASVIVGIASAIDRLLDPLDGGPGGDGWPLGGGVAHRAMLRVIGDVEGVALVESLRLRLNDQLLDPCEDAVLAANELPWPTAHTVLVAETMSS